MRDTDGEFLLIEAANELPSWVSPENADNRLWLQGGHLHLIPLSVRSPAPRGASSISRQMRDEDDNGAERHIDPETYINEEDAVRAIRENIGSGKYRAEKGMEDAVWARIEWWVSFMSTNQP
jgi:hypothetical protein